MSRTRFIQYSRILPLSLMQLLCHSWPITYCTHFLQTYSIQSHLNNLDGEIHIIGEKQTDSKKRNNSAFLRTTTPRIHLIPTYNNQNISITQSNILMMNNTMKEWEFFFKLYQDQYFVKNHSPADIVPGPELHQSPLRNWCANQRKSYMKTLG